MSMRVRACFAFLLTAALWLAIALPARAQSGTAAVSPLAARVTDLTGTFSAEQKSALEQVLADYEQQRGNQAFVLMVSSTTPEPIEVYGIRVADTWKADRKGVDDGAIILIAKDSPASLRRIYIEAECGLRGALTDAQFKHVLQNVMAPRFCRGDFCGGLSAGISVIQIVTVQENLPPAEQAGRQRPGGGIGNWLLVLSPLAIIVFFMLSTAMRSGGHITDSLPDRPGSHVVMGNRDWGLGTISDLGGGLGGSWGRSDGDFGGGGGGGGGFSGGGGGDFGGDGASGNW